MMDQLVAKFPEQLKEAMEIGAMAKINKHTSDIRNIFVTGLGGSGIGGNFVIELVRKELKVPMTINKSYEIPAYIDASTLVIVSSYSGNTEETLTAFHLLKNSGSKVVCISSGGKLIELAIECGFDYIKLPDNWPSPRACLGYSLVQQIFILNHLGLISDTLPKLVGTSYALLEAETEDIRDKAKLVAQMLVGKIPIIYTTDRMESVAVRFRQQINENSKMLCWHHVLPEMNHNELVGWREKKDEWAVVVFRNSDDYDRNVVRLDICKEIINNYAPTYIELFSKGNSLMERMMYFVHLGDWISVELAQLRNVNANEVLVIDFLKAELGKV